MSKGFRMGETWVVNYTEYERGFGQRKFSEPLYFHDQESAEAEVARFNRENNPVELKHTPDWYLMASYRRVS